MLLKAIVVRRIPSNRKDSLGVCEGVMNNWDPIQAADNLEVWRRLVSLNVSMRGNDVLTGGVAASGGGGGSHLDRCRSGNKCRLVGSELGGRQVSRMMTGVYLSKEGVINAVMGSILCGLLRAKGRFDGRWWNRDQTDARGQELLLRRQTVQIRDMMGTRSPVMTNAFPSQKRKQTNRRTLRM